MIPYSKQIIDKDDIKAVTKVLKSNFLTQGPMVEKFEKKIKKLVGAKYAIALNSATSGLHLSCLSLNLKKGDNVWTSINTFVSSANCALLCGAKVDFIDIDLDDYNLCIKDLKTKLLKAKKEKRLPKIIIPVHFAGRPCKMKEIYNLSKIYKFKIIEDASHALGSKVYNSYIGNCRHSDLAVFSFHPVKNITTGEGGVVTTNNKELCEKIRMLRTHGITKNRNKFSIKNSPPWHYEQLLLGYNYRMNDIEAALGVSQITKLKKFLINRNKIANFYNENLKNVNLILPKVDNKILNAFHLYPVRVNTLQAKKTRLKLFKYLRKKKFFINIHYIPVTKHSYFKKRGYNDSYSNMEAYYNTVISLPIFPNLNKKILSSIIKHIKVIVDEK